CFRQAALLFRYWPETEIVRYLKAYKETSAVDHKAVVSHFSIFLKIFKNYVETGVNQVPTYRRGVECSAGGYGGCSGK
ncbi:MAG: hypothetical protein OEU52_02085, partial [Xanthomonadales bacterium]|nr:hypothetical protein [Xanthomonadales bacterium]